MVGRIGSFMAGEQVNGVETPTPAGMLSALADSEYADRLEAGIYISPHQPGGFEHPDSVFGAQFSTESDQISSNGDGSGLKGSIMQMFNGGSKLKKIKGIEMLKIRKSHNEEHKGHGVRTWTMENIMKMINDYLNNENDN